VNTIQGESAGGTSEASDANEEKHPRRMRKRYNVLFLCADNAITSIMAEAILKRWGADDFRAFSAGVSSNSEIHPLAAEFLRAHRCWHRDLRSKGCHEFLGPDAPHMDFIISLGEHPPAEPPKAWPGHPRVIHWHISEPAVADGGAAEKANRIRKTSRELENRIRLFVLVHQKEAMKRAATAA
jgi:arsenate reductase